MATDYATLSGTVTIAAGATTATINVAAIVNDAIVEANETVIVTIASVGGDTQTTQAGANNATVTITDNDVATVSIAANDATATEAAGDTGQFTVTQTARRAP